MDRTEYLNRVKSYIKTPSKEVEDQLEDFLSKCSYVSGQYDQDESFSRLEERLKEVENGRSANHRIFYMALPPSVFTTVSRHLKKNCYPTNGIARLIVRSSEGMYTAGGRSADGLMQVEKPFGRDLQSSRDLQKALEPDWREEEIFRIDHYLGKEMVKNLLILRFGNEFFGATWNRNHIDNVQVRQARSRVLSRAAMLMEHRLRSRSRSELRVVVVTLMTSVSSAMSCRTICCRC